MPGRAPVASVVLRPVGPSIAVPGARHRSNNDADTDFGKHLPEFILPAQRIADAVVPNGPTPSGIKARVRYVATESDREWLETAAHRMSSGKTSLPLTVSVFEGVITALELAAAADERVPLGRINPPAPLLVQAGVDTSMVTPTGDVVEAIRNFWMAKRIAIGRPLISDLLIWPSEGGCPADTPFLTRETQLDLWLRTGPTVEAPIATQAAAARPAASNFVENAALLAEAMVAREERRLELTLAAVHELAMVRAAASQQPIGDAAPPLQHHRAEGAGTFGDSVVGASLSSLNESLTGVMALAALQAGVEMGVESEAGVLHATAGVKKEEKEVKR